MVKSQWDCYQSSYCIGPFVGPSMQRWQARWELRPTLRRRSWPGARLHPIGRVWPLTVRHLSAVPYPRTLGFFFFVEDTYTVALNVSLGWAWVLQSNALSTSWVCWWRTTTASWFEVGVAAVTARFQEAPPETVAWHRTCDVTQTRDMLCRHVLEERFCGPVWRTSRQKEPDG